MSIWRTLSALIVVYLLLISLRILLSWFQGAAQGGLWELLVRATDPYLALFARLRFLRRGLFDFTPLAAILVLVVALDLVSTVQRLGRLTVGIFLGSLTSALWSGLSFLLLLFIILAVLRLILQTLRRGRDTPIASALGMMIEPVVAWVRKVVPSRGSLGEVQCLVLTIAILSAGLLLGGFLARALGQVLYSLPI